MLLVSFTNMKECNLSDEVSEPPIQKGNPCLEAEIGES